jgi:hypothetical protein
MIINPLMPVARPSQKEPPPCPPQGPLTYWQPCVKCHLVKNMEGQCTCHHVVLLIRNNSFVEINIDNDQQPTDAWQCKNATNKKTFIGGIVTSIGFVIKG